MMARYAHLIEKLFCDLMTYTSYQYLQFQSRREFENELYERFGTLVKMPLLKSDRWDFFCIVSIVSTG
jgi:Uma2 family endonuclease